MAALIVSASPRLAQASWTGQYPGPCVVADDGTGTIDHPPLGCAYRTPQQVFTIVDGLPPDTTLELTPTLSAFVPLHDSEPGGTFGGEVQDYTAQLVLEARGTGDLDGYTEILTLVVTAQTMTAPNTPGDPVQSFDTAIVSFQATLATDELDFTVLQITGGGDHGLNSFGFAKLTRLGSPGSDFLVSSFYDLAYKIDFEGRPDGALEGLSGSTQSNIRLEALGLVDPCVVADDGFGTVAAPVGCAYESTNNDFQVINGLTAGGRLDLRGTLTSIEPSTENPSTPGGNLGGEQQEFDAVLLLEVTGLGTLEGYRRVIRLPASAVTHTGPKTPGDAIQPFDVDLYSLSASLVGDHDFASFTLSAGTNIGLPGPGHGTLRRLGDSGADFEVVAFFDMAYEIEFEGAPGGAFEGMAGTTTSSARFESAIEPETCIQNDNGSGTSEVPLTHCDYVVEPGQLSILEGLPPGTRIDMVARQAGYLCDGQCGQPGGELGGDVETFDTEWQIDLSGTEDLAGFQRTLTIPVSAVTHSGPRHEGSAVQSFDTDVFSLVLDLPPGDPDFDDFTITIGSGNELPGQGSVLLTRQPDGTFIADSFFDLGYRVEFAGAAGSQLDGMSGSTDGTARLRAEAGEPGPELDYGDAPNDYLTLRANDGARHRPGGPSLGSAPDLETEGQPGEAADGDDDEDGVAIESPLVIGTTESVTVTASEAALLDAWIDLDADGTFNGAGEQIATALALVTGANQLSFSVPETAQEGDSYARFRISSAGGLSPIGQATDGEVEDYRVTLGVNDCELSEWSDWGECSETCGGGSQTRTRNVTLDPSPTGEACLSLEETQDCNTDLCPVDCQVSEWGSFSACSADCAGGERTRTRTVTVEQVGDGDACPALEETEACNEQACSIDCVVSDWSDFGACSEACGGGEYTRTRSIVIDSQFGGLACPTLEETSPCNEQACGIDCDVCNCGDGQVSFSEQCDPGIINPRSGYYTAGCRDDCTFCGDGTLDDEEVCDDGNREDEDGCNGNCEFEPGWDCDEENCEPIHGDGRVVGDEVCDDGNDEDGDGCDLGRVEEGYNCDNTQPSTCGPLTGNCGNGRIDRGEACDDGNDVAGDGCDTCDVEEGFVCSVGECATDGDGDGLADEVDNCPNVENDNQADGDGDGVGDLCDDQDGEEDSGCVVASAQARDLSGWFLVGVVALFCRRRR